MKRRSGGFALLTAAIVLLVAASVALLLTNEVSMGQRLLASDSERTEMRYVIEAGFAHARWQLQQNDTCANYSALPSTDFGEHRYNASFIPDNGSPVAITLTSKHDSGVVQTVAREHVRVDAAPITLVRQLGTDPGKDAILDDFYANANYGGANYLQVSSAPGWVQRPVLQFDLPTLPAGVNIASAELQLLQSSLGTPGTIGIHRMTRDWVEGTKNGGGSGDGASWNTYDGSSAWAQAGGDFDANLYATRVVSSADNGQWVQWDLVDLVRQWVNDGVPNFGLLLSGDGVLNQANYASGEAGNPLDAPRLVITYSCECGLVCAGGSGGNVLLVVIDPGALTAQESARQSLIEGWDYTVNLIDESDTQTNFDAAFAVNDVVYVPQGISSSELGTKLFTAPVGVVNEEGEQVDELGFGQDRLYKSRSDVDIVDTGHYVTEVLASGLLAITTSAQPVHMLSGPQADGLRTLGETLNIGALWKPSLAIIEFGDDLYGGGTAAGRRAQLPWGDGSFDINTLTDDGRTIMRRAIEWGAGATSFQGVLFVVEDPASLTPQQVLKRDLIESWGHTVSYIATASTQAEFDTAVDAVDVVYVPELGTTGMFELDDKLDDAAKGLITEEARKTFLMSSFDLLPGVNSDNINVTDNAHYLTQTLSLGLVTLSSSAQTMWKLKAPLAADLHVLGDLPGALPALAYLEAGELRTDSSPAPARRVKLPWGFDDFDISLLTDDAREIMKRAIEWGAVHSGGGGGGGPACAATVADTFETDDYTGNWGDTNWSGNWTEINENNNPGTLDEQVLLNSGNLVARVQDNDGGGEGLLRAADLSAYATAELSFEYWRNGLDDASDFVLVEIYPNGVSGWDEIFRIEGPGTDTAPLSTTHDITAYISNDTQLRFVTSSTMGNNDGALLDNIVICLN